MLGVDGTVDLHPYDNVERRFRHTDQARADGREVVARVLHLSEPPAGDVFYDLSFFSGGIGVVDQLAITLPADPALWSRVISSLRARTPEEAVADRSWAGDLIWLLTDEEEEVPIRPAAIQFINRHRQDFQAKCDSSSRILFGNESNVNCWSVVWGDDTQLDYLGYDQG
jgi:hypothetical protein